MPKRHFEVSPPFFTCVWFVFSLFLFVLLLKAKAGLIHLLFFPINNFCFVSKISGITLLYMVIHCFKLTPINFIFILSRIFSTINFIFILPRIFSTINFIFILSRIFSTINSVDTFL